MNPDAPGHGGPPLGAAYVRNEVMLQRMSPRDCIAFALEIERAGALFYARLATVFQDHAPLRELLVSLAEDERHHEDLFARLAVSSATDGDAAPESSSRLKALALHRFFVGPDAPLAHPERISSVRNALAIALEFERNTLDSFVAMREMLGTKVNVDAVDRLIETERLHVERLEAFVR